MGLLYFCYRCYSYLIYDKGYACLLLFAILFVDLLKSLFYFILHIPSSRLLHSISYYQLLINTVVHRPKPNCSLNLPFRINFY
jgi:hypothetical protein